MIFSSLACVRGEGRGLVARYAQVVRSARRLIVVAAFSLALAAPPALVRGAERTTTPCSLGEGVYTYAEMVAAGCPVDPIPAHPCPPPDPREADQNGFTPAQEASGYADAAEEEADARPPLACDPDPRQVFWGIGQGGSSLP